MCVKGIIEGWFSTFLRRAIHCGYPYRLLKAIPMVIHNIIMFLLRNNNYPSIIPFKHPYLELYILVINHKIWSISGFPKDFSQLVIKAIKLQLRNITWTLLSRALIFHDTCQFIKMEIRFYPNMINFHFMTCKCPNTPHTNIFQNCTKIKTATAYNPHPGKPDIGISEVARFWR